MHSIYFAKSLKNGRVYVGSTIKNPEIRLKEHNSGSNSWTKNNSPLKLLYYETFVCKKDAILRERFFKTGVGKRIKKVIVQEMSS